MKRLDRSRSEQKTMRPFGGSPALACFAPEAETLAVRQPGRDASAQETSL
jgi:hypothetical protein